jgi:hypothetical protein
VYRAYDIFSDEERAVKVGEIDEICPKISPEAF